MMKIVKWTGFEIKSATYSEHLIRATFYLNYGPFIAYFIFLTTLVQK